MKKLTTHKKMKNKPTLYLLKGERVKSGSATLKRVAIADYFGFDEPFSKNDKGKPVFTKEKGYSFSVSHTGELFCLFLNKGECGIDAEEVSGRDISRLKNSFFTEKERKEILTLEDFYSLWVKKEAYGKLTGDGVFCQRGKDIPENVYFFDLSEILSRFCGVSVKGTIATFEEISDLEVKVLEF